MVFSARRAGCMVFHIQILRRSSICAALSRQPRDSRSSPLSPIQRLSKISVKYKPAGFMNLMPATLSKSQIPSPKSVFSRLCRNPIYTRVASATHLPAPRIPHPAPRFLFPPFPERPAVRNPKSEIRFFFDYLCIWTYNNDINKWGKMGSSWKM